MASFPQFYSNYSSSFMPSDFTEFPISQANNIIDNYSSSIMCGGHQDHIINNNSFHIPMIDHIVSSLDYSCDSTMQAASSSWGLPTSDQQPEIGMLPAAISSSGAGSIIGANNTFQNLNGGYQLQLQLPLNLSEFGDECCGFVEDIKPPLYLNTPTENWGTTYNQGNQIMGGVEEPNNIKVGRYSEEERKERILRYLKKRNQRNFNKTIKYACRKTLADRRVRVRGRFARNNEMCDQLMDDITLKKTENIPHKQDLYGGDHTIQFQLKNEDDEDDWLQEAMASLVYLSHSSSEDM